MAIKYTTTLLDEDGLFSLYEELGWNSYLKLNRQQLVRAMEHSWFVVYAYDGDRLIGTGRVVSDGVINGYLCGLGVAIDFRKRGIGTEISNMLVKNCREHKLHIQFFCEEELISYYENMGFEKFAVGMKLTSQ